MKYMRMTVFFSALFCSSAYPVEQGSAVGKVLRIWAHSTKYNPYTENSPAVFSAEIEGLPKACNKENGLTRFAIGGAHPSYNTVVSMILTAQTTGKKVTIVYLKTCTVRNNSWDFAYIMLSP